MFVIADLKAVQPFPFYQRMKGFDTYWLPLSLWMIKGNSVLRFAFALFIVSITQDVSNVLKSVHAMIFLEYRSIMLVRYTKPSIVQIYVISEHQTAFGRSGLNCSSRIFCNSLLKSESLVVTVHGRIHWALMPICFMYLPTVLSEMFSPVLRNSFVILGAP